jgi:hypothetical protein
MSLTQSAATAVLTAATMMMDEPDDPGKPHEPWSEQTNRQRDMYTQLVISSFLGLSAFFAFCILRPKWTELYAARRQQRCAASHLPELPDSFFGWIPVLYKITDEEVLHSAGLDAYVVSIVPCEVLTDVVGTPLTSFSLYSSYRFSNSPSVSCRPSSFYPSL